MELKYANANKTRNEDGWILSYDYLIEIESLISDKFEGADLETIEAVLLIANGEGHLL